MIISKTPLRMSFVGGGSDFKPFYEQGYGSVVSTAINKYVYVMVNKRPDNLNRLVYSKVEIVSNVEEIQNEIIRESLKLAGVGGGVDVFYMNDMPTTSGGTGLATSSAFAVGTLNALYAYKNQPVSAEKLARDACQVEIEVLGRPIGKQDQYAIAYGGFNYIRFNADESVLVEPIELGEEIKNVINDNLVLFNTGLSAKSSVVLSEQKDKIKDNHEVLNGVVKLSEELKLQLMKGDISFFGDLLHKNWLYKKKFAGGITNSVIDRYYQLALDAGASGGKILGSGGGGFLLLYCENNEVKNKVRDALSELEEMPFKFESQGSKIVYQD